MTVTLVIPGQPVAKARPRSTKAGQHYTTSKTKAYETAIAWAAKQHFREPLDGPIRLTIRATFEPGKSWTKARRREHLNRYHVQKPDLDNVQKAICDGLNGIAYIDDAQVAECDARKVWGEDPKIVVTIEKIGTVELPVMGVIS